jgi:predicted phosphohydrolase
MTPPTYRIPFLLHRLFYLSDTHLEHKVRRIPLASPGPTSASESGVSVMALLGDIGWPREDSYWNLVKECARRYDYVIMILGNHEYYGEYIQDYSTTVRQELYRQCIPNVYFLENQTIEFDNVVLWGSTLWSRPTSDVFMRMNDREAIKDKSGPRLSIGTLYDVHHRAVQNLRQELAAAAATTSSKPYILLTHHAPVIECNGPQFQRSMRSSAYVAQMEEFLVAPVVAWLYGHTHQNMAFQKNKVWIGTNAFGYPGERMQMPYTPGVHLAYGPLDGLEMDGLKRFGFAFVGLNGL